LELEVSNREMLNELSRLRSQLEGLTAKESRLTQENGDLKLKMSELERLNNRLTQELETLTKKLSDSEEAWNHEESRSGKGKIF